MCPLCEREQQLLQNKYPYLIHEFPHSWWLLGEHQYYRGYSVLLVKGHAREMTDLDARVSGAIFQELLVAQRATEQAFRPHKMNLHSLGNVVPHMHWHLFPRYSDDPHKLDPVWLKMHEFATKNVSPEEAQATIVTLRGFLQ